MLAHTDSTHSHGDFCDPQILSWSKHPSLSGPQRCSDCWLRSQVIQLRSPFGYDAGLASNLASLTSSCRASGFDFASPTAYALNTSRLHSMTVTSVPTKDTHRVDRYTVRSADNCHLVAKALNVSTYSLLEENGLDLYCNNFQAAVGQKLYVSTHRIQ